MTVEEWRQHTRALTIKLSNSDGRRASATRRMVRARTFLAYVTSVDGQYVGVPWQYGLAVWGPPPRDKDRSEALYITSKYDDDFVSRMTAAAAAAAIATAGITMTTTAPSSHAAGTPVEEKKLR